MRHHPATTIVAAILLSASASLAQPTPAPALEAPSPDEPRRPLIKASMQPIQPPPSLPSAEAEPLLIKWNEGEVIPRGYHLDTQPRLGLVISGSVLFTSAWVPSLAIAAFGSPVFAIPSVGPFITAAESRVTSSSSSLSSLLVTWVVIDGLQQTAGLAMLIAGFAGREPVLRRNEAKSAKPWWLPLPMPLGPRSAGLGFAGAM